MEKKVKSHPKGRYRRRNSYILAIERGNMFIEPAELVRRQSIDVRWNGVGKKSSSEVTSSLISYHGAMRTPSLASSSVAESPPEVLRSYPELLNALLQYQSANSCSCRKDSSSSPSIVKYPGSGLSISTCQSSLPVTARNSTNALNHPHDPHRPGDLIFSNGRRHSDLMPWRLAENRPRRLSDQPLSKLCHCNDSQSTSRPSSALDKSSKSLDRSFSPDLKRNSVQRTSSRSSIGPITPKMMKRRFSEQLILEGGLSHEPEFDQLVDEEDLEESLTAINARKKVTLKRHYYPEGQWGYTVAVVAVIIQTICHGLQVGFGVLLGASVALFHTSIAETEIPDISVLFAVGLNRLDINS